MRDCDRGLRLNGIVGRAFELQVDHGPTLGERHLGDCLGAIGRRAGGDHSARPDVGRLWRAGDLLGEVVLQALETTGGRVRIVGHHDRVVDGLVLGWIEEAWPTPGTRFGFSIGAPASLRLGSISEALISRPL